MTSMTDFGDKDTIQLRIGDEKQDSGAIAGEESGIKYLPNPWESSPRMWNKIFLVSCVIGALIDPLFLYIPVINEDKKCLTRDEMMKDIALVFRSIMDLAYILDMAVRVRSASKEAKKLHSSIWTGLPRSYLLIDILSILPVPQVIFHKSIFRMMAGSKSLIARKFLYLFLLAQYVPRILRIYLSAKDLGRTSLTLRLWVRGVFNIFLYIIAGHVFGASWYFYSILTETYCWHNACKYSNGECKTDDASFYCDGESTATKDLQYLNKECPVNPPSEKQFGIFAEAIESRILVTYDFPQKFSKCFWWGFRNLSSSGQNLVTSSNMGENFFAVLISILGLLLFLYLIGNVQTYMQLSTTKAEETTQSAKRWISENNISSSDRNKKIIEGAQSRLQDGNKDVDIVNILSVLNPSLGTEIKEHLCLNTIQKVPMLQNMDKKTILDKLTPVIYPKNTYIIRKGEPADFVLFITQGAVWSFGETSPMERLKRGDYYGSELIEWQLMKTTSYSAFPISTKNVKSQTKVEAFVLMAADLEHLFSHAGHI